MGVVLSTVFSERKFNRMLLKNTRLNLLVDEWEVITVPPPLRFHPRDEARCDASGGTLAWRIPTHLHIASPPSTPTPSSHSSGRHSPIFRSQPPQSHFPLLPSVVEFLLYMALI